MTRPDPGAATGRVRGLGGAGAIVLSLAAALGVAVGARAVLALEGAGVRPLLGVAELPREALGMAWSAGAAWPADVRAAALERATDTLGALFFACVLVAFLNALVLLVEEGAARRRELAVRAAVGAGPRTLALLLARQLRALLAAGAVLGLGAGMAGGALLRMGWPGPVLPLGVGDAALTVTAALGLVLAGAAGAYVWIGLRMGRTGTLAGVLGAGARTTADRAEVFRRRALSAVQMGTAGAVALAALSLSLGGADARADAWDGDAQAVALRVAAAAEAPRWDTLLAELRTLDGLELATLATPGAIEGLGLRDVATAQCGRCVRGGLPLPIWGARVEHHAVAPGFLEAAGLRVVEGRGFTDLDGPGARRVALVNRTFADTAFERGQPIGRQVRLGRGLDDWYLVVGIVEDGRAVGLGGDDLDRSAVYVSALQNAPRNADLVLRGTEDSIAAARAYVARAGLGAGEAEGLEQRRREARAPMVWSARVGLALAALALLLALHGSHVTALQVTRRRLQELAVRRALGADGRRLAVGVLSGSALTALWGSALAVFLGTLLAALLRKAWGGVPAPGPGVLALLAAALVGTALVASARAVREALAVAPADALE